MDSKKQKSTPSERTLNIVIIGFGLLIGIGLGWVYARPEILAAQNRPKVQRSTETIPGNIPGPIVPPPFGYTPIGAATPTRSFQLQSSLQLGSPAPGFTLKTQNGNEISLASFLGKPVIINFWASWCIPCKYEMPALQDLYTKNKDSGLVILGINATQLDQVKDAEKMAAEMNISYPVLYDPVSTASDLYQIINLPVSIFVDRSGIVSHIQVGEINRADLEQMVSLILSSK